MKPLKNMMNVLQWMWRSVASIVALVLILLALVFGWWLGQRNAATEQPSVAAAHSNADGERVETADEPQFYTCSMHPQIRLPDPDAKCPICFMDLIPVVEDAEDEGNGRVLTMTPTAVKLAQIQTTPVVRRFPEGEVRLVGKVDYDETRLATIAAYFPGRIERMYVDYTGVQVRKGDHLVDIYSPELLAAQEELKQSLQSVSNDQGASDILRSVNQAKLNAARDKLRLWGLTDEQIRQIETTDEVLEQLTIYSPMAGVVIQRKAVEGQYLATGEPIYRIADLSQLWVRLEAYESQLPWLHYGQNVEFTSDSFPGETFAGRISFISPTLDEVTRTVRVRVNVDNEERRLKPGMFVRATVRARMAKDGVIFDNELKGKWISPMHPEVIKDQPGDCDVCGMPLVPAEELGFVRDVNLDEPPLVIPASAPLITGKRAVVYIEIPGRQKPAFEGREVVLGPRAGDSYIVHSGLREGERVVTEGNFKIDSALQIAAKPSMMSPEVGATADASADDDEMMEGSDQEALTRMDAPTPFLESLEPVYEAYFEMRRSLSDDDFESFKDAAPRMHQALKTVDTTGLSDSATQRWREIGARLRTNAGHVAHLESINAARNLFLIYSSAIIEADETFGHLEQVHYVQFCPMAFGNEGAAWLAAEAEIANPYYGDMMLRCGEITKEIAARTDGGDQ